MPYNKKSLLSVKCENSYKHTYSEQNYQILLDLVFFFLKESTHIHVSLTQRSRLFLHFILSDCISDLKSKEIKRACLNEIVDYITVTKNCLTENVYPEAIHMVCNLTLFRFFLKKQIF